VEVSRSCRPRSIATLAEKTPLLVPSFSSRGFPDVAVIQRVMSDYLFDASLVSAYDVHHGLLSRNHIYTTGVLILDSGGYEARPVFDPGEPYGDDRPGLDWTLYDYQHALGDLEPLSRLVVVSFDCVGLFSDQIRLARSLFDQHKDYASDFLCKPTSVGATFIDVDSLITSIDEVASFDVLGITEKELGESVVSRCRKLIRIREALQRHGHETPIHVFGCLDPMTILAYFLCGADIFDGLAWLRFAFVDGMPIYHASSTILKGQWAEFDQDVVAAHRAQNLKELRDQARAMRRYSLQHDLAELARTPAWAPQVLDLIRDAGLKI